MLTLYGIPNCDRVRKARAWLTAHGIEHRFHDFRRDGLPEPLLRAWLEELGWDALINRQGTTWSKVPAEVRKHLVADGDQATAVALLLASPSLIRRPVLDTGRGRHLGFSEPLYQKIFGP